MTTYPLLLNIPEKAEMISQYVSIEQPKKRIGKKLQIKNLKMLTLIPSNSSGARYHKVTTIGV